MSSYIPTREADLQVWVTNFSALITAAPAAYGLVAADATAIANVVNPFNAAVTIARDPVTRTKPTVADKNAKKAAMLQVVRGYAMMVKANDGVSDENKVALGLALNDADPTPVPVPVSSPILAVVGATPLQHELRYAASATPDSAAKPPGATALMLYVSVGDAPPPGPETCALKTLATRNPVQVPFGSADVGKTAHYYGRWVTRRGLAGPWSQLASMTIAA